MNILLSQWNRFVNVVALIAQYRKFILAFKYLAEFSRPFCLNYSYTKKLPIPLNS